MKIDNYPENYTGPKAGQSTHEEWIAVRDFNAFKYVRDGIWSYSDFDCYLYSMCSLHYGKGGDATVKAFQKFYKLMKIPNNE